MKERILAHDPVCAFLELINFDFSGDEIKLTSYQMVRIQQGIDAIDNHQSILNVKLQINAKEDEDDD